MDAERWEVVSRLFLAASDLGPEARAAFLDDECSDPAVRAEVEAMLEASAAPEPPAFERFIEGKATRRLDDPTGGDGSRYRTRVGEQIGQYVLKGLVGQGGMSDVYRAERVGADFDQTVAVKVLAVGLRGPDAVARFRAEGRIQARLSHPNIARMLDGGVTDDGVPYLVMEFVDGSPITEFCDRKRLTVPERLDLFREVCTAVRFAHANLVVHRDLKPSNVLVTQEGDVRLLDFGIAKLLSLDPTGAGGPQTQEGSRAMTPDYAAPEQIEGGSITTATDVYGLGLILFELLTGRHPYRVSSESSRRAIEDSVLRSDPPSLVAAATTPDDPTTETPEDHRRRMIQARATDERRLRRHLTGDLETIVRKALHRDPHRRYESPTALADDIERYLRVRPIRGRRDTFRYRFATFARRNRPAIAVGGILGAAAFALGTSAAFQYRAAQIERDRAEVEKAKALQVQEFMVGLFQSADPLGAGRDTLRVAALLDEGAERVESELGGQPEIRGAMLAAIGQAYGGLGRRERATELLSEAVAVTDRALGPSDPASLETRRKYGEALAASLEYQAAADVLQDYLDLATPVLDSLDSGIVTTYQRLSGVLHHLGRTRASDSLFTVWEHRIQVAEFADTIDVGGQLMDQGRRYWIRRDYDNAVELLERAVRAERALHGERHPAVGMALNALIPTLWALERYEEAEQSARTSVSIFGDRYADGHRYQASAMVMLGESLVRQGKFDDVEDLYLEALDTYERLEGPDFAGIGEVHRRLGHLERARGAPLAALPHYERAVSHYEAQYGTDGLMTLEHRQHVAAALRESERFDEAEDVLRQACARLEATRGEDNQFTQECRWRTVTLYEQWGRDEDADRVRASTTIPDRRAG